MDAPGAKTDGRGPSRRAAVIAAVVASVVLVGLIGLVVWAVLASRKPVVVREAPRFDRFEPAWASAMAKAGVEATFPAGPVDVTMAKPFGRVPFEATFTAEEITALLNVYRYQGGIGGQDVSFESPEAAFPRPGVGSLSGQLATGGSSYSATIVGPVTYAATGIDSPGATELTVEGFSVRGDRRTQASEAVIAYLNMYVRAAPGLTVQSAEIVQDGLRVTGSAPARLEHPPPLGE